MGKSKDLASGNSAAYVETAGDTMTGNLGIGASPSVPLDVVKAGGGNFVAKFQNTTDATPYGVHIKDASSGANGYPLLQVTNSAGSVAHLKVNSGTGHVTMASQPAFGIKMNVVSGINATSSTQVIAGSTYFNSSSLQQTGGSNFAVGTGRFTAPVSGFYQFNVSIRFDGFNGNYIYITLVDNGAAISRNLTSIAFTYKTLTFSKAHYLHANDYSEIHINCSGDTSVVLDGDSYFSGYLIG